ncbi:MAG: D-hexose-6-phosphate mutarotase [Gammaproteobacteria bacterium]|nr:D-hexose-6-phosphate mutarotase [Gammaproteobacteria bacterium]
MSNIDYSLLNERFGLRGQVTFREGAGGLAVVEVSNSHATAALALQGGHLMRWAPRPQSPVIWLSRAAKFGPGKSIRGGVPVCWPWFGPHSSDASLPAHGFARTVPWEVTATRALPNGATGLSLRLVPSDATRAAWPYSTEVMLHIIVGTALEMNLVTHNTGNEAVTLGQALHTYFEVGDVRRIKIHGLGGCEYIDKVDGGARKVQNGPVTIAAETDRIYLGSTADCLIDDPQLRRRIRITKGGSRSTVVWNPWIEKAAKMGDLGESGYLNMVCVESANAADDVVTLAPEAEHRLWVRYSAEGL